MKLSECSSCTGAIEYTIPTFFVVSMFSFTKSSSLLTGASTLGFNFYRIEITFDSLTFFFTNNIERHIKYELCVMGTSIANNVLNKFDKNLVSKIINSPNLWSFLDVIFIQFLRPNRRLVSDQDRIRIVKKFGFEEINGVINGERFPGSGSQVRLPSSSPLQLGSHFGFLKWKKKLYNCKKYTKYIRF